MKIIKNFLIYGEQIELYDGTELQFTPDQIIIYSLLVGNDYTNGIKGIGKKRAEKVVLLFETIEEFAQFVSCCSSESLRNWNIDQLVLKSTKNENNFEYFSNLMMKRLKNYEIKERKQLMKSLELIVSNRHVVNDQIIQQFRNPSVSKQIDIFEWNVTVNEIQQYIINNLK